MQHTCEICGNPVAAPEWLYLTIGPLRKHCWCGPACLHQIVVREQAHVAQRRQEIGDLVEAGMQYLRKRQAVPPDIRAYMTPGEWDVLRKQCDREYTQARQALVSVLAARAGAAPSTTQPTARAFVALKAAPASLFFEE